ncbi:MAG: serine/threonine-protein kinase [Candidatus Hydrothermales bacterium]
MRIGKYEIVSEIKKDTFVEVYKVFNRDLKKFFFLKSISKDYPEKIIQRFKEEARICASINHPNTVKIYDLFEKENRIFVIYEWVEGLDVSKLIEISGVIEPDIALIITYKALDILEYIHEKGIIHRDIKPSNILISNEGFLKLTDFGIAKTEDSPELTKPGFIIGTPYYMSPEQVKGEKLTFSSDLFSLGATLYEMLTGKKAFQGEDVAQILIKIERENPSFSRKLFKGIKRSVKKILKKSLSKKHEKRYKSAKEFKNDILRILGYKKILDADRILRDYIEKKRKSYETGITVELERSKDKFKEKKKRKILIYLIFLIFSLYPLFFLFKKTFYPHIEIISKFEINNCLLNNKKVNLPFKGQIPPGNVDIRVKAPSYLLRAVFNVKLREKKIFEIPFNEKDSLIFRFRGTGEVFVNKNKIGKDSVDYNLKPGIPFLFEIIKNKDTFSEYIHTLRKDVIWILMP